MQITKWFGKLNEAAKGAVYSTVSLVFLLGVFSFLIKRFAALFPSTEQAILAYQGLLQAIPATLASGLLAVLLAQLIVHTEN